MFMKTSDNQNLYYETHGDRSHPALLLLHGLGADHRMWEPQVEKYTKQGYFLIIPDMRAHGQSPKAASLTLKDWTRDLAELLDHLDIRICTPIGVSMGGVIAQQFAADYPESIKGLVLCDTFGELKSHYERFMGSSILLSFKLFKAVGMKPQSFARMMSSSYKPEHARLAREYFHDISLEADFEQLILARAAINRIDVLSKLQALHIPALVMAGNALGGKAFLRINQKIADALHTPLVEIPGGMDPSNLTNPEAFDSNVLEFCRHCWEHNCQ